MTDNNNLQRGVLPIPDQAYAGLTTYDAKDPDTSFPPIEPLRPPKGAPNVLVVLIDDCGFGASSAFGGPISTPVAERLAANGLKYNRFHTTALCSPTRAALLSGRNHHAVGMGGITEIATSAPGYTSIRPNTAAPLAETLKLNGYSTAQFGKCHEVPVWETSPMGPFDSWPSGGGGFEYFYGFIGGETNQYAPAIYHNTVPVEPDRTPEEGYHFTEDMTDRAIDWVRQQKALMPDKPFFMYYAPGRHACPPPRPGGVVREVQGKVRPGVGPPARGDTCQAEGPRCRPARCSAYGEARTNPCVGRHAGRSEADSCAADGGYARFLEHTDHHIGRLVDALGDLEVLDDTLVYYIIGDNGASAEGTPTGCFNELVVLNGAAGLETVDFMRSRIDDFGTPAAYNHYAVGWAHAMDTPYQWTKQVASHWGGTRNGTIVHWPNGIKARGEIRTQFSHVIDVAATALDAAGLPEPTFVHGVQQMPLHGKSMLPSFKDANAPEHRETQYFEMFVNRGIYHKGWTAVTRHSVPWDVMAAMPAIYDDVWELYGPDDWTQSNNFAAKEPDRLRELQQLFILEAGKYNVFPLDDRRVERFNPDLAGRPTLIRGKSQMLFGGMGRLTENSVIALKNKSHSITGEITVPEGGANGVILSQGGAFGGFSLYLKQGKPAYCYNLFGLQKFKIYGDDAVPAGDHQVRMEFAYDGGGLAKGGNVTLYVDGKKAGEGRVAATEPMIFSDGRDHRRRSDSATPVSDDYGPKDQQVHRAGEVGATRHR